MSFWAQLDKDKKVIQVIVADDDLEEVQWFSVNELPEMRLDGNELIQQAYKEICL